MKKGSARKERITVEYKGDNFILQPGHQVYELNLKTGVVKEHKINKKFNIFFWQKPRYAVQYKEHLLHLPAFNLHKAITEFKHITRNLGIKIKGEFT